MNPTIGIDIGFRATGIALVGRDGELEEVRVIETARTDRKRQLLQADDDIVATMRLASAIHGYLQYRHYVRHVVVELPSGGAQGARANRAMGIATGVIGSVLAMIRTPLDSRRWVTPTQIKRLVRPHGAVTKLDVINMVQREYPTFDACCVAASILPRQLEHVADAAAAVLVLQTLEC